MVAKFLGVRVWDLARVALHYQEEARVILQAQYEARMTQRNKDLKAGAMAAEVVIPEF